MSKHHYNQQHHRVWQLGVGFSNPRRDIYGKESFKLEISSQKAACVWDNPLNQLCAQICIFFFLFLGAQSDPVESENCDKNVVSSRAKAAC